MGKNTIKLIMFFILIIIIVIAVLVTLKINGSLITGDKTDIIKVEIIVELNPYEKPIMIVVEDKEKIGEIYDLIKKTHDIRIKPFPSHSEGMHSDGKYSVVLCYSNGKVDCIYSIERSNRFYKYIDSKGLSREKGFVSGTNEYLWEFLNTLNPDLL